MFDDAEDERWMVRALALASLSLGRTWPNPGVGCVIARDGVLLGQGRHEVCGQAHAEVRALQDCRRRGRDPAGATAYITLAPCTRHGRQPPCLLELIGARLARVVAAIPDPIQEDPASAFGALGIAYEVGLLGAVATHLHGGFLSRVRLGRPRITGKWAMTLDGCISPGGSDSAGPGRWISSPEALSFSRRRRRAFDAIVIGANTVVSDDPQLLAQPPRRHGEAIGPLRVVISAGARLESSSRLVATLSAAPLLVIHSAQVPERRRGELRRLGVQVKAVADAHDPAQVARALAEIGCNDVLVEGGSRIHTAFLRAGMYDRLELYLGLGTFGGGVPVVAGGVGDTGPGPGWIEESPLRGFPGTLALRLRRQLPAVEVPLTTPVPGLERTPAGRAGSDQAKGAGLPTKLPAKNATGTHTRTGTGTARRKPPGPRQPPR
jgi:diaminohydroxyphosphoribosylaminopyrimidine deaminase/5-amino-6-(5-phosphoribosylamino)uracil reductase